jgi:pteridine reductase
VTLNGKTALVTGGAKRIGAAIARRLHAEGMNVVVHYQRSQAAAQALAEELEAARPGTAVTAQMDLAEVDGLASLVKAAAQWGSLDLLVNNASTFRPSPLGEVSEADWDDLFASNLKAPFFLAQAAAPALREAEGAIVNIVDIYARRPLRRHTVYCAAKAGLEMLTRSLARELAPTVRVNGVAPGAILWPEAPMDVNAQQKIVERIALKRTGSPEDIAGAVVYLARDAGYVTGTVLPVDGGRSIGWG